MQQNRYNEEIILEIKKDLKRALIDWYGVGFFNDIICIHGLFQHLRSVNISGHNISFIPKIFGTLPTLQKLDMSNNCIGQNNDYSWLEQTAIKNNLLFLNLSGNSLTKLPIQVTKLNKLIILIISHNKLTYLPQSVKNIKHLMFLDVSNNNLLYLPGSISKLRLYHVNILKNLFSSQTSCVFNLKMPTLTELSAKVLVNQRPEYDALPGILIKYIDKANYCYACGSACFDSYIRLITTNHFCIQVFHISIETSQLIKFECYFCSLYCYNLLSFYIYAMPQDKLARYCDS